MEKHFILIVLGVLLLLGLLSDFVGRRTHIPRVTLLMLFGVAMGPLGLDLLPAVFQSWYDFIATVALTMVAFLIGGSLSYDTLQRQGQAILIISIAAVCITMITVGVGLLLAGASVTLALLLAGMSTATDPAATQDVVRQTGASGPFTKTLIGVVAIDDAWGLIVFSLLLVVAKALAGDDGISLLVTQGLWEVLGACLVGLALGFPGAYLTGRIQAGEPSLTEAIGIVLLCAGVATWLQVSYLLAGIVTGVVIVNFAHHHRRPFREIEHIEWPFMILFFVLAGSTLHLASISHIGLIGAAYIFLRALARFASGWAGSMIAGMPVSKRPWVGLALFPQAGVALGMALIASSHFPAIKADIMAIAIGTTVVFELVGPMLAQLALARVGETSTVRANAKAHPSAGPQARN